MRLRRSAAKAKNSKPLKRLLLAALCAAFALGTAGRAGAQFPSLGGAVAGAKIAAAKRGVGAVLNAELPIKLDASNLYPTVPALPGAPFDPKPLNYSLTSLSQPLPPGDYEVTILAFCTEYSIHRPGAGVAYSLGPLLGKAKEAVANLLWRGTWDGVSPSDLQGAAWSIQSGLTFDRLPKTYQALINRLVPEYKGEIAEDFYQKVHDTYDGYASNVSGMPSLESMLGGLGTAGELALSAQSEREALTSDATDDKIRQQTLFAGSAQGVYTPQSAEVGPWTVRVPGVAYLRYKIVSGNLSDDNIMQIRLTGDPAAHLSLLDLFQGAISTPRGVTVTGMIGYPRGQGAQDLIPVLRNPHRTK
jgi:hypothetical protein